MGNTFANREVCDLIFEDYATKTPFLNMDYAVRMERTLRNLGYPTVLVKERAVY